MAGQVLKFAKHDGGTRRILTARPGRKARLYEFPSHTPLPQIGLGADALAPARHKGRLGLRLVVELAFGLMVWLTWFVWHLMR